MLGGSSGEGVRQATSQSWCAARVAPMHFLYLSETLFSIPFQL